MTATILEYGLSPTMEAALALARQHDGKLVRFPGGFWSHAGWRRHVGVYFGTSTVEALVRRGALTYTRWKQNSIRKFPIEASITGAA